MPESPIVPEEQDRADLYGLLSALLLQPDPALLDGLAALPFTAGEEPLPTAWRALVQAARCGPAAVREEYSALFLAAGTPRLNPYQCYYLAGWLMDKPLVALRQDLHRLGLARQAGATELEDHLGVLCEAMRVLIASGRPTAQQRAFFSGHLAGWSQRCLADMAAASADGFYAAVARFAQLFLDAEARAFALEEAPVPIHPPRTARHVEAAS